MKVIVFLLAILAVVKVGAKDYLQRSASSEVIFVAYRDRAADACQRDARAQSLVVIDKGFLAGHPARVAIGKPSVDVYFWQTEHEKWNARYRNPYLHLTAQSRGVKLACEYDIVNGAAAVSRM